MKKSNQRRLIPLWILVALAVVNIAYPNAVAAGVEEDFETGDFSRFSWEHTTNTDWTITSSEQHSGDYSAQAGAIGDSKDTTLRVTLDCDSGTITFYHKVSCESGYDFLTFYIDGTEKDKWSGEEDWTEASFPVISGMRTFEWTYSKDGSVSEYDDTAWIDDIAFPIDSETEPPAEWTSQDINTTGGSASEVDGIFTVIGDGTDIHPGWLYGGGGGADGFHYVYRYLRGDGSITARVVSIGGPGTDELRKAGVMMREELSGRSKHATMVMMPAEGCSAAFQWRRGGPSCLRGGSYTFPCWVRLVRQGDIFSGYISSDGNNWLQQGSSPAINMRGRGGVYAGCYIGLCLTSHQSGILASAEFDNVSLTGSVTDEPPPILKAWNPQPSDGAEGMTALLLQWTTGDTAKWHDVYFGINPTPSHAEFITRQESNIYDQTVELLPENTYYWRVDEVEANDTTTHRGDVWSFTTAPSKAWNPNPANGASFVYPDADLSWCPGTGVTTHDVYFSTNKAAIVNGTENAFKGNQSDNTFNPGNLARYTTYYWRVDEVEIDGATKHRGNVWSFTTRPPSTTYEVTTSSYIGGSSADDSVRGCGIQSDGTVVLAANIGNASPANVEPILLNGVTQSSSGAIIRLSPDGTTVLSVTRLADLVLDLALDDSDNIYVALWTQGMAKLDPTAAFIHWQKEQGNVSRIDAGPTGYCAALVITKSDPDTPYPDNASIKVFDRSGNRLGSFSGHRRTFDVCIDEATQTIAHIGWRQSSIPGHGATQIAYSQGRTYEGDVLWTGYDWSVDPSSSRFIDRPRNNWADTRGYRCSMGRDGKLYCIFECAGGDHIFHYDPFDIMQRAETVGGDRWFEFWNTGHRHKIFMGRYEPATGEYLLGQQFCCRQSDDSDNTVKVQLGQVCADELGRVYVSGRSAWGLPLPGHPRYTPAQEQIAFNPFNGYLGGGFLLVLSQDFKTRLYCTRLTNSISGHNDYTHVIAARVLSGTIANIAFGGSSSSELYRKMAIQSNLQGDRDGWFAVIPPGTVPSILHVDTRATGNNNGTSWENAFNDLQEALGAAAGFGHIEIRVAQGVYTPDRGRSIARGNRNATFQLVDGVAIKGGYAGLGKAYPSARDIEVYQTVLSGDLNINDVEVSDPRDLLTEPTRADNSRNVVTGSGTDNTAFLDGFSIMGGYADRWPNSGGGMNNESGSPTVTNCMFIDNCAVLDGGGMCNRNSSSPILSNCTFIGNRAENKGGGVYNVGFSNPKQNNCIFVGNSAEDGGGLYNEDHSSPNLINCDFRENSAEDRGGGLGYELNCNPVLMSCMFTGNTAGSGGGIRGAGGNLEMTNCIFNGNSVDRWGGGLSVRDCDATLTNCTFSENSAEKGGGMSNWGTTTLTTIINCTFHANEATRDGGGMWISSTSSPTVINCIFSGNSAIHGGGVYNEGYRGEYGATSELINSTFYKNSANSEGGGVYAYSGSFPILLNCILWGDTPEEIYLHRTSGLITYSDIQGGWEGQGNINADPQFADPAGGDYHLKSQAGRWDPISQRWIHDNVTSPCIDTGDPSSPVGDEPQSNGGQINMGAYGGTDEASKSIR